MKGCAKQNGSYKWWMIAFLWVAFFLHQGTRQIYNATLPLIQTDFGVTKVQIGLVGTVFTMTYGIVVLFSGIAADFLKRKWMVVSGIFIFCLGVFCSGAVSAIGAMLATYGLLNGAGQAFYYPAACSLIGQLHEKTRATALAIHQTALYAGIVICSFVSGKLGGMGAGVWRHAFYLFGGIGVAWAVCLIFLMRDTPHPSARPEGQGGAQPEKASLRDALLVLIRRPSAVLLVLAFGMMIYVDVGFKTWMPSFLHERFDMPLANAAFHAVVWHYIGAFIGVTAGSRLTDRWASLRKGVRFESGIVGLALGAPFILWMARASAPALCCAGMLLFGVFRGVYDSNLFAALFDVVAPRYRASASGLMLCCAFIIGSTSATVLGWISQASGPVAGMASLAGFYLAGALFIAVARIFFYRRDAVSAS